MSTNPVDRLEIKALEQRHQVHATIDELKDKVEAVRNRFDPNVNARKHLLGASLALSCLGFLVGYGFAGLFTRS